MTLGAQTMNDRVYYSREAEMQAQRERMTAVLVFMVMGLGIGAVLALLFAPKSGDKTRSELAHTIGDSLETPREVTSKAINRLEKDFTELRKKVEERLS
jgi:gas vesicle protein